MSLIYSHRASPVATTIKIEYEEGKPLQESIDLPIDPGHSAARPRLMSLVKSPAGWMDGHPTMATSLCSQ